MFNSIDIEIQGLLNTLIKEASSAIAVLDKNMCYLACSDRWISDYNIEKDSIIGQSHYDFFPDIKPEWIEEHQLAMQGQRIEKEEELLLRDDGSKIWMKRKYIPWRDNDGEVAGILICNEVTTVQNELINATQTLKQTNKELEDIKNLQNLILENYPDYIFVKDKDFKIIMANSNFISLYPPDKQEKIIGYTTLEEYRPEEAELFLAMDKKAFAEGYSETLETVNFPNGDLRILHTKKILFEGNEEQYILGIARDVTEQKNYEDKLEKSEERFQLSVAGSTDGLWDWDIKSNNCWFSPRFKEMLGYSDSGNIQNDGTFNFFLDLVHSDDLQDVKNSIEDHKFNGSSCVVECRLKKNDGQFHWFLFRGQALWNKDSQAVRMSGSLKDINQNKLIEKALYLEKEKAIVTLTSIGDAVITTDIKGIVEFINPVAEKLTGYRLEAAKGKPLDEVFHIKDEINGDYIPNPVQRCIEQGRIIGLANHTILINRDGSEYAIEDSAAPIRNQGVILGVVLVFKDVTETRRMAREMSYQASHDHLTGLVNRREFERRLKRIINTAHEEGSKHATCYLDLDQFKVVNDTCGHTAGDELLKQLANVLKNSVRKRDTIGRLGGDEFGIIMEHCDIDQAYKVCEKVLQNFREYSFVWDNKTFSVGASLGLVPITLGSESITGVLRSADAACYTAKDDGRNRIHVYREDDEQLSKRHGEMQWVSKINKALEHDHFILYSQKIKPCNKDNPHNLIEILIRIKDENDKIIPPALFLPAAERYGLSQKIDRWVIRNFFMWYQANLSKINPQDKWCINLSGLSLSEDDFLTYVEQYIDNHKVPAECLCFEITETAAIANLASASLFVNTLHKKGCSFSLDDFGSGLSSFAYLKNLSVDYLKIDGVFVKDINHDPIDYAMVKSINEIGHVMGIKTIAEFVEDDSIIKKLETISTDYIQGYGVHKPCHIDEILTI